MLVKYIVEIESEIEDLDYFHKEMQLAIDSVSREGELNIIQIEKGQEDD